ncbi:MAG: hypothetical protein M1838_000696 [Thelocarpon superellum]|nr:MAG: hypothetical protein M1838_000696 [Thelocarpon superellum]
MTSPISSIVIDSKSLLPVNMVNEDVGDGPLLSLVLTEEHTQNCQVHRGRSSSPGAQPTKPYRPSEQQLLQEGKLGQSEFSARLKRVIFGRFGAGRTGGDGVPACLILVKVDLMPKSRGWFRFREVTVEISFLEKRSNGSIDKHKPRGSDDDDDNDDDDEENTYTGPLVLKFYPEIIRGHVQTASDRYQITASLPIPAPVASGGLSMGLSGAWTKEGLHLIHGRLMGEPETRVKWKLHENEVVKGGVYEQPLLAVVVRHDPSGAPFTMALSMKATTYGGISVTGKGGSRITFRPGKHDPELNSDSTLASMAGLAGGAVQMGGQTWQAMAGVSTEPSREDLDVTDLEALTGMKAALLGLQAPGVAAGRSESAPAISEDAEKMVTGDE